MCHYGSPRHFERRYKPVGIHSFVEPVKGSREISLQNAALRQSVQHRVSFLRLPSYTLSRCAGLPLKGKQGLAAELAMCCLSPAKHSAEFAFPLWCLTAPPFSTGKRLTWFSGRYHSPTNQVRLPPRCAGKVPRSGQGGTLFPRPQGRLYGFIIMAPFIFLGAPTKTFAP